MDQVNKLIDRIRNHVKTFMTGLAKDINSVSGGRVTPNHITLVGLTAHVFIAILIAFGFPVVAAFLLIVFGLFDALDGALARLQNKASNAGMLLDASTDRMKEVLLYSGAAYALVASGYEYWSVWAVGAVGSSLLVSYIKAKGETAVAGVLPANEVNRLFQDGLMRFEIRMFFLVIGLLFNILGPVLVLITIASSFTAVSRLLKISNKLDS